MKLLGKPEVNVLKAQERRKEVEEGVKLAKRVDNLREKIATDLSDFVKFKNASLNKLKEDLMVLQEEKDTLLRELPILRLEKADLRRPLDREWEELSRSKVNLAKEWTSLREFESDLTEKEQQITQKKKNLAVDALKLENLKAIYQGNVKDSEEMMKASLEMRQNFIKEFEKLDREWVQKQNTLINREEEIEARSIDLKNERDHFGEEKKDFIKQKILLADREKTLEREYKRLKK